MGPGAMAFTRMPRSIKCVARPFVKVVIAPCMHIIQSVIRVGLGPNGVHKFNGSDSIGSNVIIM